MEVYWKITDFKHLSNTALETNEKVSVEQMNMCWQYEKWLDK